MSKHMCFVPYEWDHYYKSSTIEVILKKEITCDHISKQIRGVGINVNGVTAHLHYWSYHPWMKKDKDKKAWPHPNEYFSVYMSCYNCKKPVKGVASTVFCSLAVVYIIASNQLDETCTKRAHEIIINKTMTHRHQVPCWIPRTWLAIPWDALRVVLSKEILEFHSEYGRVEGSAVDINGTTAR